MKLIILIMLFTSFNIFALDCPTDTSCGTWSATKHIQKDLTFSGIVYADIWYRQRNCNGTIEYVIDSLHANDNAGIMDSVDYLHFNFKSFFEILMLSIIEDADGILNANTPDCSQDTIQIAHFYTASCGVWVKCSYKIEDGSRQCDTGYEPPYPDYINGANKWVDIYKWQSCGDVCCKRTYSICKQDGDIKITQYQKDTDGDCTGQGTFINWKTGLPIPCQVGC